MWSIEKLNECRAMEEKGNECRAMVEKGKESRIKSRKKDRPVQKRERQRLYRGYYGLCKEFLLLGVLWL